MVTRYIDSINRIIEELTQPTKNVMEVISAVANGDLTMYIDTSEGSMQGEYLRILYTTIFFLYVLLFEDIADETNRMLRNLNCFSEEVTRVIRDVGIEGKFLLIDLLAIETVLG
jgi:hypothetical protein